LHHPSCNTLPKSWGYTTMIGYSRWVWYTGGFNNQLRKPSSPLVLVSHFDQQDEDSSLLGNATYGLNRSDGAQSSEFQFDILPPNTQL
jgi:hypothetical protein